MAAVDAKHQVIVEAQAHGTGSEQELLIPVVNSLETVLSKDTLITADAGYHSEANLAALAELQRDALIPENDMRARDERFADSDKHKQAPDPLHNKTQAKEASALYTPLDFQFDREAKRCTCPAGQSLQGSGSECNIGGYIAMKFKGSEAVCVPCTQRDHCLRTPEKTKVRQVTFFVGQREGKHLSKNIHTERMKQRIDSAEGRAKYGRRFATVEPVFANLRHNMQLNRLRAAQPSQGGRAVEAVRLGAQHREAGAPRVCAKRQARPLSKGRGNSPTQALKNAADRVTKAPGSTQKIAQKF